MSAFRSAVAAAVLAMSTSAASAQALTNGPNGTAPNTLDSQNSSTGINAKKPSRAIMNRRSTMYNSGAQLLHPRKRHQSH